MFKNILQHGHVYKRDSFLDVTDEFPLNDKRCKSSEMKILAVQSLAGMDVSPYFLKDIVHVLHI